MEIKIKILIKIKMLEFKKCFFCYFKNFCEEPCVEQNFDFL